MRLTTLIIAAAISVTTLTSAFADFARLRELNPRFVDELHGLSRRQLLDRVTDRISPTTAMQRYLGDFDAYWKVTASSRTGKFAEAQVALGYRRFAAVHGHDFFITPTAIHDPRARFDLLVTDGRTGQQIRYQMKLGAEASIHALDDVRYAGGRILVPRDTLESVRAALRYEEAKALRHGRVLSRQWQTVKHAIASGRLTDMLPGGYRVAARDYLTRAAERFYQRGWGALALPIPIRSAPAVRGVAGLTAAAKAAAIAEDGKLSRFAPRWLKPVGQVGGHLVAGAGAGFSLYRGVSDYERYQAGTIGADELAARWTGRAALATGSAYAAIAGGPAGVVIGGIVLASEAAYDRYDSWQDEQLQQSLKSMERVDQYEFVRATLLRDAQP